MWHDYMWRRARATASGAMAYGVTRHTDCGFSDYNMAVQTAR
ncbi:MAG: hypothetical protein P8Q36_08825 [Alphaproteobacteria bacterium]|nr:hypothetical protein [Alphaproteobacteria bacterium]